MGLFGGSKRTSITETHTQSTNVSQGFENIEGPAIAGDGNVVTLSDHGAVASGERVALGSLSLADSASRAAIGASLEATGQALGFADAQADRVSDFARGIFESSLHRVGDTAATLGEIARQQSTSSDERVQQIAERALYVGGVVVGLMLLFFLARQVKS